MSPGTPHLVFATSEGRYAVPAEQVVQVVWLPVLSETSEDGGACIGVAHLQDDEVPVVDLDLVFGDEPEPYTVDHRLIDVDTGDGRVGIVVAEVDDVVSVDEPETVEEQSPLSGVFHHQGDVVGILAVDRLVAAARAADGGGEAQRLFGGFEDGELEELARRQRNLVSTEEQPPEGRAAVLAEVGGSPLVVPLDGIREFVTVGDVTPLPLTPDHVLGLANQRGEIVSVVDVSGPLGLAGRIEGVPRLAAIVDLATGPAGIAVDRVGETIALDEARLEDASPPRTGVEASVRREGGAVPVLDPGELLASPDLVVDQEA